MTVLSLTTASRHQAELVAHDEIVLVAGRSGGIVGDRHVGHRRAVTIVCTGELAAAASRHGVPHIDGVTTRRNIVVDLDELPRAHGTPFTIGDVQFTVWRDCAPCNLMDDYFGAGAQEALRNRCGISATVVIGGTIRIGDSFTIR